MAIDNGKGFDFDEHECPVCWIGDLTDYTEDGSQMSLQGLRDLLDAVAPAIEASTPMVRLFAAELADAIDNMGDGL